MLITIAKILLVASCMFPIGACAIAAGILFSGYNLAVSRNPEEKDLLFGHTLMWFAFIETFMFMSFLVVVAGVFSF
jgi:F0F1-type ATP synthase membrane subunit c/vacuolar-type H+-ATPase subunit K